MLSHRNTEYVKEYIKKVAESVFTDADHITVTFDQTKYYVIVQTKDGQLIPYSVVDEIPGINNSNINFVDVIEKIRRQRDQRKW